MCMDPLKTHDWFRDVNVTFITYLWTNVGPCHCLRLHISILSYKTLCPDHNFPSYLLTFLLPNSCSLTLAKSLFPSLHQPQPFCPSSENPWSITPSNPYPFSPSTVPACRALTLDQCLHQNILFPVKATKNCWSEISMSKTCLKDLLEIHSEVFMDEMIWCLFCFQKCSGGEEGNEQG